MNLVIKSAKWVMLASGILTSTMFYGLFAPQAALESMFGTSFEGVLESIIIRSWSSLVGLIGAVLIFGAFSDKHRLFSISLAAFSKVIFLSLVFVYGQSFLHTLAPAIAMDCAVIVFAGLFLVAMCFQRSAAA